MEYFFLQLKVCQLLHYVALLLYLSEALQNVFYDFHCLLVEGISSNIFSKSCY